MKSYWIVILIGILMLAFYRQVGIAFVFMGVILWVLAKRRESRKPVSGGKSCPQCGQVVAVEARLCSSCKYDFTETDHGKACDLCGTSYLNFQPNEDGKYYCHRCLKAMGPSAGKK